MRNRFAPTRSAASRIFPVFAALPATALPALGATNYTVDDSEFDQEYILEGDNLSPARNRVAVEITADIANDPSHSAQIL